MIFIFIAHRKLYCCIFCIEQFRCITKENKDMKCYGPLFNLKILTLNVGLKDKIVFSCNSE